MNDVAFYSSQQADLRFFLSGFLHYTKNGKGMSKHTASIRWQRMEFELFTDNQYSRAHTWEFDGGLIVPASPSPSVVPIPLSVSENVDPEEAYVAALSSCHMLTFLSIAAKQRFVVESYTDRAEGLLSERQDKKSWISKVILHPKVRFSDDKQPSKKRLEKMHHLAHEHCFIANSVKTEIETKILID